MDTAVIGVVEYKISDTEAGVIDARYLSTGSMMFAEGVICRGRATGDTETGFPGTYVIQYRGVDEAPVGEFDWEIVPAGEGYRLYWRNRPDNAHIPVAAGDLVFEGFGFPTDERTIAVTISEKE